MKSNKFTIRKIPLEHLLMLLNDIFASGADFVDIHGIKNEKGFQDEIAVGVPMEYMTEDMKQQYNIIPPPGVEEEEEDTQEGENIIKDIIRNA